MEETISLREFARRLEVGEKTIRDGIKNGKLSKGVAYDGDKPKIIYSIALQEAAECGLGSKVLTKSTNPSTPPPPLTSEDINGLISLKDALRAKENYIAKIKELEFKEKEGSLVKKDEVYSQLFDFHKNIRDSLLAIPDRIVDTLLSYGNDRNKAYELLYESIAGELDKLKTITDEL
jgi:hypothetical protein